MLATFFCIAPSWAVELTRWFWNLRSYDRINTPWQKIKEMEQRVSLTG